MKHLARKLCREAGQGTRGWERDLCRGGGMMLAREVIGSAMHEPGVGVAECG